MTEASPKDLSRNMLKVAEELFHAPGDRVTFLEAIRAGDSGSQAVVWVHSRPEIVPYAEAPGPSWVPRTVSVVSSSERPGKSEQHEHGELYCLDLSSVFACVPLSGLESVETIIDVCAAPGGKGILAWSLLSPESIVANETIRKRTAQLISNYKRCRIAPSLVTSLDPQNLSEAIAGQGSLVIVDAPCSGQSLVLKGLAAPGAFHPSTVSMNARRQRRILANSAALAASGAYLLYATCTFSREENEENIEWFLSQFRDYAAVEVPLLAQHRSVLSSCPTYRLWPFEGWGAGAFCALLKKSEDSVTAEAAALQELTRGVVWRSDRVGRVVEKPQKRRIFAPKKKHRDRKKLRPWEYE